MSRPETMTRKPRVKLEDKPLCTPKRGRAHHWLLEPQPNADRVIIGRCKYCRKKKEHPVSLNEWQRFETIALQDPRPAPALNAYRLSNEWKSGG